MSGPTAYLPQLSVYDPAEASEGSLDPLGLSQLATELAEALVPGFTERSRRPRFLTALAFGARLLDRAKYEGGVYGEHSQGPANIAFERLLNESFARCGEPGETGLLGVPGIGKARVAAEQDGRLTSPLYLVAPGAVGLWVAYKRLARELLVIDETGHLLENGFELLRAWEIGIGRPGLATGSSEETAQLLGEIDRALEPLLDSKVQSQKPKKVWEFLYAHLKPNGTTPAEARALRRLIIDDDERRSDVFSTIAQHWKDAADLMKVPEERMLQSLAEHGAAQTRRTVEGILAYERVVVSLLAAFDSMRFAGSARADGRIDCDFVLLREDVGPTFAAARDALRVGLQEASSLLDRLGHQQTRQETLGWLDGAALDSPAALFDALLQRHFATQRSKPPDGKRPWIEGDSAGYFVRTRYVPDAPPVPALTFHPYRTGPVRNVLSDFWRAEA